MANARRNRDETISEALGGGATIAGATVPGSGTAAG